MFENRLSGAAPLFMLTLLPFAGCGEDVTDPKGLDEQEVITTVTLRFTPQGGGADVVARFDDPDGEGGTAPTIDPIALTAGSTYALTLELLNGLASPPEDITEEIEEEADEHQFFFTGTAVEGPATPPTPGAILGHAYDDADGQGAPIGLTNVIVARRAGTGVLTVTLRHLPPVAESPVKDVALATRVASGGISSLPGDTDVAVSFDVTVD